MTVTVDPTLLDRLRAAGGPGDQAALIALVEGVVASDRGGERADWLALAAPDLAEADGELKEMLLGLQAEIAGAKAGGVYARQDRLAALRVEMKKQGVDAFLVPRADAHQGEYVSAREERLKWLTGFTGSAGLAVIASGTAAMFVDGRYTIQVRDQVDNESYEFHDMFASPASAWLRDTLSDGKSVGYDPRLHTPGQIDRLRDVLARKEIPLVALDENPLDAVWTDQPAAPLGPVSVHPDSHAGESASEKRTRLAAELANDKVDGALISAPDGIAWLLNMRGGDVPCTPLPLGFALLMANGTVKLFMDDRKFLPDVLPHLGNSVEVGAVEDLGAALDGLAGKTVLLDEATGSDWARRRLEAAGAAVRVGRDPCAMPRAAKNATELDGSRAAHRRDGLAVCRFLFWYDQQIAAGTYPDELEVEAALVAERRKDPSFRGPSFETIAGSGPHGAINHYRCTPETNRRLQPGELLLLDSGGQYPDGTTDITRTMPVGEVDAEYRRRFTLVLQGHILLGSALFPVGTTGSQLDALARYPLWQAGFDYDHGTGHGVGSFLSVHEGPQRISKVPNTVALKPGMILSNEPGFYKTAEYGIRIENLVAVVPADKPHPEAREMLKFEDLTLAPIDRRMIVTEMLSDTETAWVDAYHQRVWDTHEAHLAPEVRAWLAEMTRPLAAG